MELQNHLRNLMLNESVGKSSLEGIVADQDKGTTSTSEDVGKGTLEESLRTFVGSDLLDAVESSGVKDVLSTRLHHESSSNGIQWVGEETSDTSDELGNHKLKDDVTVRSQEGSLESIVTTEVGTSVGDNTEDGDTETSVKTHSTISLNDLSKTINKTLELSVFNTSTGISSQSSSGEVQWVDEEEGSGTSSTSGGEVTEEEPPELSLGVEWAKVLLVGILEGEVKSLSREVSDDVGEVTSVEGTVTFFLWDSGEDITNTLVWVGSELGVGSLGLEQKLNSFDGSDSGLGDGSGNTTSKEVDCEVTGLY